MPYFAVLAIGIDGPGIVAALTGVLAKDPSCKVQRSEMMHLSGHFAALIIASTEKPPDLATLERELSENHRAADTIRTVRVTPIEADRVQPLGDTPPFSISVNAENGNLQALHEVATLLADSSINITTLCGWIHPDDDDLWLMSFDVDPPRSMQASDLEEVLKPLPDTIHFEVRPNRGRKE